MGLIADKLNISNLSAPENWLKGFFGSGMLSSSGKKISATESVNKIATVYACIDIISTSIATLPFQIYKKTLSRREKMNKHAVAKLLYTGKPNEYQTPFEFKQMLEAHRTLYGNGYAEIVWGKDGYPKELWPLHPTQTFVGKDKNNKYWVITQVPDGSKRKIPYEDVLHIKGLVMSGLEGISPIAAIREQLGIESSSLEYTGKFFANGTVNKGILTTPGTETLSKESKDLIRGEWEKYANGLDNAHRIAILDSGLSYQQIGINQIDAQFIETQKFTTEEVAKVFRVPLHMLGQLDRATFSNIEQQSLDFLKSTLISKIVSWEENIKTKLFTEKEQEKGFYIKVNVNAAMRGDSITRASYYREMQKLGNMNINEARELEDMDPIVGGDEYRVDLNSISLTIADKYQLSKSDSKGGD
ncbi:MAG: phage portal protein [Clostridia bacterium]